jgi:hypothetical protein
MRVSREKVSRTTKNGVGFTYNRLNALSLINNKRVTTGGAMLKFLRRRFLALNHGPAPAFRPSYGIDGDPDEETSPEEIFQLSAKTRTALRKFVLGLCGHLDEREAIRLARNVSICRHAISSTEALIEGLTGDGGQDHGKRVLMQVDWKAADEVVWQAQEILAMLLPDERWSIDGPVDVQHGLDAFDAWLAERGHALVQLESEEDAYYAFVVPQRRMPLVLRQAAEVGLIVVN